MRQSFELTPKQKKIFEFIQERIRKNIPPTIREIAKHMGFSSTGTVRDYLKALENKGYLRRKGGLSRSIELLKGGLRKIPILASIMAGGADLAYEDIEGYVDLDELLSGSTDIFALRVKGDSMIEAGIREGDIALIRKQSSAYKGDIVAALLDNNEATLKRLRHRNGSVYLEAANKDYPPIFEEFSIIGKVITIIRKY
jgi:repressor LexA